MPGDLRADVLDFCPAGLEAIVARVLADLGPGLVARYASELSPRQAELSPSSRWVGERS